MIHAGANESVAEVGVGQDAADENAGSDELGDPLSDEETEEIRHRVCGVFQGGGARGVAYVGALVELRRRHCWFDAVAGASAGAIVATFIAARMLPKQMETLVPLATASIKPLGRRGWLPVGTPDTLGHYDTGPLRLFIEGRLRAQIGVSSERDDDVTFEELYRATGIELNIVVLSAPDTPIVLSVWSAPRCQVSYAAVASSAIPVVMTPQVLPAVSGLESHFVVDGGAWANYPAFVFKDPSVRAFYGAPPLDGRPIVGFVLKNAEEPETTSPTFLDFIKRSSSFLLLGALVVAVQAILGRLAHLGLNGKFYGPEPFLLLGGVVGIGVIAILARQLIAPGATIARVAIARVYSDPFTRMFSFFCLGVLQFVFLALLSAWTWKFGFQMTLLFLAGILASYATLALSLGMFRYGEAVFATGLPAVRAAMRATTGVAEWVGASGHDLVVRVPVMHGVDTTSFALTANELRDAVEYAATRTAVALDQLVAVLDGGNPAKDTRAGVRPDLVFLTPTAHAARLAKAALQLEERNRYRRRWGTSIEALSGTLFLLIALHFASDRMTPSAKDALSDPNLFHPSAPIAVAALGAVSAIAFALGRLWEAIPVRRVRAPERSHATVNALMFVLWWTISWGALTQVLQTRDVLAGGRALAYHGYFVSRLWDWFPGVVASGPVAAPVWAQSVFVVGSLVVALGLGWRLMNASDGSDQAPDS